MKAGSHHTPESRARMSGKRKPYSPAACEQYSRRKHQFYCSERGKDLLETVNNYEIGRLRNRFCVNHRTASTASVMARFHRGCKIVKLHGHSNRTPPKKLFAKIQKHMNYTPATLIMKHQRITLGAIHAYE